MTEGGAAARPRLLAVAWAGFQPRTAALARALGGRAVFVGGRLPPGAATAPLRYLSAAVRTWRDLGRERPDGVLAVTPPVVLPALAWLWCRTHGRPLVVDCHTGAFHSSRWAWAVPVHRWLLRRSRAALVHTDEALALVEGWGAPALLVPDDLPEPADAGPAEPSGRPTVMVAGSLDENEPVAEVLAAAALVPDIAFRVTGDPARLPAAVRASAPPNVALTGYLPYATFLGEMRAADAVAVFSTDPHIMNRAAFEAVGLGRPLVLSDLEGLRRRFGGSAVFASNEPPAMAEAMRAALEEGPELAERSRTLALDLRRRHRGALDRLRELLAAEPATAVHPRRVLRITQHPFPADSIVRRDVLELLGAGVDVDVVCPAAAGRDDRLAAGPGRLRVLGIPIRHRRGGAVRYVLEYAAFTAAAFLLAAHLSVRSRYAAVQVDNLPDVLVAAALVPRLRGARVVFTMYELTPEMVASRFEGRAGRAAIAVARAVEAAATRFADTVIVVSGPCREALRGRGVPEGRMTVVLNTTSWDAPRPRREPPVPPAAPVLVTHTTLVERYGVHIAIRALAGLRASWPDLTLRIVGGGEQRPELERLARELGVDDRVVFTGLLPWSGTLAEVARATLGIVPILDDGYGELLLPTKLLEYAWLGVPAVCSRLPAIQAYFPDDAVAFARPGSAGELAAAIDRLLRRPEVAGTQAERAAEIARALSWERVRGTYLAALGLWSD